MVLDVVPTQGLLTGEGPRCCCCVKQHQQQASHAPSNRATAPGDSRRIGRTGVGRLAPGRSGPLVPRLPARPSPSGCDGSVKVDRTRSTTPPAVPCAAPAKPISCRKQPSPLFEAGLPRGRTASGGGWASPAPPSTPSCAAPDSTASHPTSPLKSGRALPFFTTAQRVLVRVPADVRLESGTVASEPLPRIS